MKQFQDRIQHHDDVAVPLVIQAFRQKGFECFNFGVETDDPRFHELLMQQKDRTSLMLRFRPDRVFVKKQDRSILCEIKSASGRYYNYSVEADSFRAAVEWDTMFHHVMYAFVDLGTQAIMCCWAKALFSIITTIIVPKRNGYRTTVTRMKRYFPQAQIRETDHRNGSGTPYFLFRKNNALLQEFSAFLEALHQGPQQATFLN